MKTITKTFYINDMYLEAIKSNFDRSIVIRQKDETGMVGIIDCPATNEIQISWTEPEKKIEITESEFDDHYDDAINELGSDNINLKEILRRKFFGASDER